MYSYRIKCKGRIMKKLKIGYLAVSKASWITPKIREIAEQTCESLKTLPDEILFHGVTTTEAEAVARTEEFRAAGVDAVVMHFVTFPVGAVIPAVAQRLDVPFLLIGNPEVPGTGKMWEQNSFCGLNMAAHGMNRLRKRYSWTMTEPEKTAAALSAPLAAVRAMRSLAGLRIGLAGGRVPGFYTSNFDELQLRRELGVAVEVFDLLEIVKTAET
jgi:L-fucose isomerase-like protein